MSRWKRYGVIIILYKNDHDPMHVHLLEDRKRVLKFDIEHWRVISGVLTPRTKRALEKLREATRRRSAS